MLKFLKFLKTTIQYLSRRNKYKNVDFFQYEKLAKSNIITPASFTTVFLYGNYKAVARLKGGKFNFWTEYLEHGVCFFGHIDSGNLMGYVDRKSIKKIYTYGEFRKQVIQQYVALHGLKKEVIAIGPYIKGAKHFYAMEELRNLKNRFGKILLVYPSHTIPNAHVQFDMNQFVHAIKKVSTHFDHVFVCLFWHDIISNYAYVEAYEKQGFVVVCNGHRGDPKFLNRQKDLIYLSDMVMTNGLGTHAGYAICMNTPVYYYEQPMSYQINIKEVSDRWSKEEQHFFNLGKEFHRLFGNFSFEISEEQKDFIKLHWGEWKNNK